MMNPLGSVCLICIYPQRSLAPWPTQLLTVYTLVRWTVRKAMALVFSPERRAETSNHMMCQVQVTGGASLSSLLSNRSVMSDSETPWTAALQASLPITNSWSLLKLLSMESVMPSNHLILCRPLLPPSVFPSVRVFSNESVLHIRWPEG